MRLRLFALVLVGLFLITGLHGPATALPTPASGIVFPIVGDPTFNPWHPRHFVESVFVTRVLFNGLTRWGRDSRWVGDLAESWDVSADGLTWTFRLRRGVRWHDGREFTADDVKFTYDIVLNPRLGAQGRAAFTNIRETRVVDRHTIQFLMSEPQASLVAVVGVNAGILPRHAFTEVAPEGIWAHDAFNKRMPIGTGPFRMRRYVSGSYVILERNPAYFGGAPLIDTVTFRVLPDVNAQIAQFLAGDLTLVFIDNPALVRAVRGRPHVEVTTLLQNNFYYVAPNHRNALFQDRRVRQAMMYALDRPAMIRGFLEDFATPASSPLTPVLRNFFNPNVKAYEFNRARARELLAAAGWRPGRDGVLTRDGQRFRFTLSYPRVKYFDSLAALLQQYWRAVGIETVLDGTEFTAFVSQRLVPRQYDALLGWWIMPEDPDFFPYLHSSAAERGFNLPMYSNREADRLLEAGRRATSVAERERIYMRLQELMAEDLPYLHLWWPKEIRAWNRRLEGVPPIHLRAAFQWVNEWRLR